jgi:hypothetical protein
MNLVIAKFKIKIELRHTIQTCPIQCKDGSCGQRITTTADQRFSAELESPSVPVLGINVSLFGGGSGGGMIVNRYDTCTGMNINSGCYFTTIRFGAQGCGGVPGGGRTVFTRGGSSNRTHLC